MAHEMTTKAQEALSAAVTAAQSAGNPSIEPAHLLKALAEQTDTTTGPLLEATGTTPQAVIAQAEADVAASGLSNVTYAVDDAYAACAEIKKRGGRVTREAGPMKHGTTVIAFVEDPDGYKIELINAKDSSKGLGG